MTLLCYMKPTQNIYHLYDFQKFNRFHSVLVSLKYITCYLQLLTMLVDLYKSFYATYRSLLTYDLNCLSIIFIR